MVCALLVIADPISVHPLRLFPPLNITFALNVNKACSVRKRPINVERGIRPVICAVYWLDVRVVVGYTLRWFLFRRRRTERQSRKRIGYVRKVPLLRT